MTTTEVEVDTSDLDLLDDEFCHARCPECTPKFTPMMRYPTLCGREAITRKGITSWRVPRNACPDCLAVIEAVYAGNATCPQGHAF